MSEDSARRAVDPTAGLGPELFGVSAETEPDAEITSAATVVTSGAPDEGYAKVRDSLRHAPAPEHSKQFNEALAAVSLERDPAPGSMLARARALQQGQPVFAPVAPAAPADLVAPVPEPLSVSEPEGPPAVAPEEPVVSDTAQEPTAPPAGRLTRAFAGYLALNDFERLVFASDTGLVPLAESQRVQRLALEAADSYEHEVERLRAQLGGTAGGREPCRHCAELDQELAQTQTALGMAQSHVARLEAELAELRATTDADSDGGVVGEVIKGYAGPGEPGLAPVVHEVRDVTAEPVIEASAPVSVAPATAVPGPDPVAGDVAVETVGAGDDSTGTDSTDDATDDDGEGGASVTVSPDDFADDFGPDEDPEADDDFDDEAGFEPEEPEPDIDDFDPEEFLAGEDSTPGLD